MLESVFLLVLINIHSNLIYILFHIKHNLHTFKILQLIVNHIISHKFTYQIYH